MTSSGFWGILRFLPGVFGSEKVKFPLAANYTNVSYKVRLNLSQPIDCYWWRHHRPNIIKNHHLWRAL